MGWLASAWGLAAAGPALVEASVRGSLGMAGATATLAGQVGRVAVGTALAVPGAALREATVRLERPAGRRVWSDAGRAHVQVRGLTGARSEATARAVEAALAARPGVHWARVDAVTRRAVIRFDPDRLDTEDLVSIVAEAEAQIETETPAVSRTQGSERTAPAREPEAPPFPADPGPVRAQKWALMADLVGFSAALTGTLARLPPLPGGLAAASVLVDNQPRLRRLLEDRLGPPVTDLVLAASNAVALGLTQGSTSLALDAAQRAQGLDAARTRRRRFEGSEARLWDTDRPGRSLPLSVGPRPVGLPKGPVERYADRAGMASLVAAAGLLAGTRSPDLAAGAVLVGAPKAARAAREAFADTLIRGLSDRAVLVMDPAAVRVLDRLDTVVVDSGILHGHRPVVIAAQPAADHWTLEHVWSAAQRLLADQVELSVPPPRGREGDRLALVPQGRDESPGVGSFCLLEDQAEVGRVLVGTELDPLADAVIESAHRSGLRVVLVRDYSAPLLGGRAHEVIEPRSSLAGEVRRLQADGRVVLVISDQEEALAAADLGVGVAPDEGRVPWSAHVLVGPGLAQVPPLLASAPVARGVSSRGVTAAAAGSFLGALVGAVGGPRGRRRATLPVTLTSAAAMVDGTLSARAVLRRPPPPPVLQTPWHALEPDEVRARLPRPGTPPDAPPADPPPGTGWRAMGDLVRNMAGELADPLTPVLATGAAASAIIGSPVDALLVGGVLVGNALISGAQRLRADLALRELLGTQQLPARLVLPAPPPEAGPGAGEVVVEIPASGLQPGHVVTLGPGDVVPADARLLGLDGLEVDEASLTGESVPVGKQIEATPGVELPNRACMVYEGTTVLAGTGRGLVVAVGPATEAGRALSLAASAGGPAGMQARLEELTRRGLPVTLLGGAAVTALAVLRGQPLRSALGFGVSVAVAAVPEGLPLVATVAQTGAARRLSTRGVLVRSARTVEALGRVDTVCFDKTGTLTEGRLRLARLAGLDQIWALDAQPGRRVLRAAARACPRPQRDQSLPHATDQAIIDAAQEIFGPLHSEEWEELSELAFQSERGFSAALGRTPESLRLVVKGAPEVLLPRCTHVRDDEGKRVLDQPARARAEQTVQDLAGQGLRVLAVARRNVSEVLGESIGAQAVPAPEDLTEDLTLVGFVALADTARPEAAPTVAALQAAGLATVMITGDHPATARAIAAELGVPAERVVTGADFAALDDDSRAEVVSQASVFARVSPEQKLRIIAALQRTGRVVAMTGDGANDAAAIRLADVGIALASHGSTSARTAADLVLTRPDLHQVIEALVEGRAMWGRVRDAVAVLLGGNAGEIAFTLLGTALTGRAPIGTRQFLLVNMLTDLFPSMAIALAPTPQDPHQRLDLLAAGVPSLGAPLLRDLALRGVATGAGAAAAWQVGRMTGTRRRASTMGLAALVGTQLGQTLLVGGRNPVVLATGLASAAGLAAIIQTPGVSQFFGCTPLDPWAWLTVGVCAAGTTGAAALGARLLPGAESPASRR